MPAERQIDEVLPLLMTERRLPSIARLWPERWAQAGRHARWLARACAMIAKGLTVREAAVRLKIGKTALYSGTSHRLA